MNSERLLHEHSHALRERLLSLSPASKRILQITMDVLLIWLALWLAFVIRLGEPAAIEPLGAHAWLFTAAPLTAIPLFLRCGLYRTVMRYLGPQALTAIGRA